MTRTQPAIIITFTVDPSPEGDITHLLAYKDIDDTLVISIYGQQHPSIVLNAHELAALTNLLNQGAEPMNTRIEDGLITNHKSPIPARSADNATLSEQEDQPTCST